MVADDPRCPTPREKPSISGEQKQVILTTIKHDQDVRSAIADIFYDALNRNVHGVRTLVTQNLGEEIVIKTFLQALERNFPGRLRTLSETPHHLQDQGGSGDA